jgi:hypothetical protein
VSPGISSATKDPVDVDDLAEVPQDAQEESFNFEESDKNEDQIRQDQLCANELENIVQAIQEDQKVDEVPSNLDQIVKVL